MLLIEIESRSPSFNLAIEESLFSSLPADSPGIFLLWQNDPAIIIGRHQTPSTEVNLALAIKLRIPYFRRVSGGGAVYHDPGNLNYSFIERSNRPPCFRRYLDQARRALRDLDVRAEINGRNDLEIDGIKVGGCAQILRGDIILCHGCLLFDVDLHRLASLLTPSGSKLKKHGVYSIASRVGNIKKIRPDLTIEDLKTALARVCASEIGALPASVVALANSLEKSKYLSEAWNGGQILAGREIKRASFAWGEVEWSWNWKDGKIADSRVRGDFFATQDIANLEKALDGLSREELANFNGATIPGELFRDCVAAEARAFFQEAAAK